MVNSTAARGIREDTRKASRTISSTAPNNVIYDHQIDWKPMLRTVHYGALKSKWKKTRKITVRNFVLPRNKGN